MAHFEELYPGRFLKGVTLAQPKTIRIIRVHGEVLEADDERRQKAILKFKESGGVEGEIVLCKTNAALIAAMFGGDYSRWSGKLITIHFDPKVKFGSEMPGGIRVCGSPEITEPLTVKLKRPRRKNPDVYLLNPTVKAAQVGGSTPTDKQAEITRLYNKVAEIDPARAAKIYAEIVDQDQRLAALQTAVKELEPK